MSNIEIKVEAKEGHFHHRLMLDGEQASDLEVIDLTMRIGVASVHTGGIGGVGTKGEQRGKGYSRRVLETANEWMAQNGFDCATLFGINDYYDKFGYAVCLPECRLEIPTRHAESALRSLLARPYTPEDLPALREIYAANNARLTGSIARHEKTVWFRKGTWYSRKPAVVVFTESNGEVVAYIAYDETNDSAPIRDELRICEVGARRLEHIADVVHWISEKAIAMRLGSVSFELPPDSDICAFLTQYGAEARIQFPRCGSGMGRLLNLTSFFEKTLPEWTLRARETPSLKSGTSLQLETDIGGVTLVWTGDAVTLESVAQPSGTVKLPQYRLMQSAMGYHGANVTLCFPEVQAESDMSLFRALFPRRLPYMWRTDHF